MMSQDSWMLRSKTDPKWDDDGEGMVGMLSCPFGALESIENKKEKLGEDPPADLTYSYMKN